MEVNFIDTLRYSELLLYHEQTLSQTQVPSCGVSHKTKCMRGDRQVRRKFCFIVYKHDLGADKIFALVSNITLIG